MFKQRQKKTTQLLWKVLHSKNDIVHALRHRLFHQVKVIDKFTRR